MNPDVLFLAYLLYFSKPYRQENLPARPNIKGWANYWATSTTMS